jgi:hypothetical protein
VDLESEREKSREKDQGQGAKPEPSRPEVISFVQSNARFSHFRRVNSAELGLKRWFARNCLGEAPFMSGIFVIRRDYK